jgi:glycosyltransferase involved in cell wall biosynthesis
MIPKILIINTGWWKSTSGGCTHLFEVGTRIQNKGVHVDYIIPTDAEYGDYMNQINNIKAFDPEVIGKGKDCKGFLAISYLYWKRQRVIIKYMKKHKEDMKKYTHVICSGPFLYSLWPVLYLKKHINPRCKTILYWHHLTVPSKGLRYRLAKLQEANGIKNAKKYFDLIITSNKIEQEKLKQLTGLPVEVTSHGVSWNIIDNCINTKKKPLTACFVGRLEKSKGVWDLLTAWERVVYDPSKKYSNAKLYMIGSGIEEEALKKTIDTMGLNNNIVFQGHVTDLEKYHTLLNCQLFLSPSTQEGWNITIAEALACGSEVIAYNLDHYEGIFGSHIKTVPIGRWQDMASSVVKSFNSPYTLEKINDQAKWARNKFNWNQVAKDNYNMWIDAEPKSL